jgi:hypothetical protein
MFSMTYFFIASSTFQCHVIEEQLCCPLSSIYVSLTNLFPSGFWKNDEALSPKVVKECS